VNDRLADGKPPLRVSEVAEIIDYSSRFVQKLMDCDALASVRLPDSTERRIPTEEVCRLREQLGLGG